MKLGRPTSRLTATKSQRLLFEALFRQSIKGPAVTVLKAAKSCFSDIVEVSGIVLAREETMVRPERLGLKVAEVLADAGDSVTAGQTLAPPRTTAQGGERHRDAAALARD